MYRPVRLPAVLALLVLTGCGDDTVTGPRPDDFDLTARNLIVERPDGDSFTPEFRIVAAETVDVGTVRAASIEWPAETGFTVADPAFEPFGNGWEAVFVDEANPRPLVSGTYWVSLLFEDGSRVAFSRDQSLTLLASPTEMTLETFSDSFSLEWTGPTQPHDWSVALYSVIDRPGPDEITFVLDVASGSSAGGGGFGAAADFQDAIEPGEAYLVRLILENDENRRVIEVSAFRPEGQEG